MFLVLVIHT